MKIAPIDKRLLIHSVKWNQSTFKGVKSEFELNHVRIHSTNMYFIQTQLQTMWGNWVMLWDKTYSTPLPKGRDFSVGDTISWNSYPKIMTVVNVKPCYGLDSKEIHHIELILK